MDSRQQEQEGKKRPSLLKRIGRGISDFLCKKVIDEEITIKVKADWLLGRKPEAESKQEPIPIQELGQTQPLEKEEEVKAEAQAIIETPAPTETQSEFDFDKPAEPIEQPVEKPAEKPVVEEKKAEAPEVESPKPTQLNSKPAPRKRVVFKCDIPPSKIKTWIRQLAPTRENWRIQENILSAGPACLVHLMEYVENEKAYTSSRQTAIDMIVNIWERYSTDKSNKDIVFFYADQVLPFFGDLSNQELKTHATGRGSNRLFSEVKKLKKMILGSEENEKNIETSGSGKDI